VDDQRIDLLEAVRIEQQIQPLAGGQLPARVLLLDPALAPAEQRLPLQGAQPDVSPRRSRPRPRATAGGVHR
jgi:hypothetical protein